ncbi:MAG: DUF1501 domain-containing protein [Acidobacteria bacterium]|nr:DUF1501 domain-containing protein [Acidobacteriota bacterium]
MLKGGTRGSALIPGDPVNSRIARLAAHLEQPSMPPGRKPWQIEVIRRWIGTGAPLNRPIEGAIVGETDEFGYKVAAGGKSINDLHATILHLAGLDHEKLTYFHNGRHMRLTDVSGTVIREIVA